MYTSPSVEKMIVALKREFRSKGLQYRDVAARLKVSEGSVKRYLSKKGVTLAALENLAKVVDLDLLSLATLAARQVENIPELSAIQQTALLRSKLLRAVYFQLLNGWTPEKTAEEFELQSQIKSIMARLQSLGLIRKSTMGVQILARPRMVEEGGRQLGSLMYKSAEAFFADLDVRDPNLEWISSVPRLSRSSLVQLQDMIRRFILTLGELSHKDDPLSKHETQWYRFFIGARPVHRSDLLKVDE